MLVVEMSFQPFHFNYWSYIYFPNLLCNKSFYIYPKLCHVSKVSLVDNIYGIYFDIVKFLNFWVYLHCDVLSPLQQIYPTLING